MPPVTKIDAQKIKDLPFLLNAIPAKVGLTQIPKHALLLGAGCSYECGIPLGGGIIELCQLRAFINDKVSDGDAFLKACGSRVDIKALKTRIKTEGKEAAFKDYVDEKTKLIEAAATHEKEAHLKQIRAMLGNGDKTTDAALWKEYKGAVTADAAYGFWINNLSESDEMRQQFIEELMDGKKPDGAYILLSYLIAGNTFGNVLTTNFDDLINEALIYYTGTQCRFYADDELSKYITIHSTRPNIIKLHGDFRFANMRNTAAETNSLSPILHGKLQQLLGQLGLIIIGYNGADHSIMSVLYELKISGGYYPLIWCGTDPKKVHWRVAQLINTTSNSFFIKIDSFAQLAGQLFSHFRTQPKNLVEEAEQRQKLIDETLKKYEIEFDKSKATHDEKKKLKKAFTGLDYFKQAYAALGLEEKVRLYTKGIKLDPGIAKAYNNRGNVYNKLEQYGKAIEDFNKAVELDSDLYIHYNNRGNAYYGLKQYKRAIEDYAKAMKLSSDNSNAYIGRGNCYYSIKQYKRAVEDYDKAIELKPDAALAYNNRSLAYTALNQPEKAAADKAKAKELGWSE